MITLDLDIKFKPEFRKKKTLLYCLKRLKFHWPGRFGWAGALAFLHVWILEKMGRPVKKRMIRVRSRGMRHPFYMRAQTSDPWVYNQIFVEREYSCLKDVVNPQFIVDCGANVGYSSIWFLNQYPGAKVLAVEPDAENFEVCRKNLEPYGKRAAVSQAAIWPRRAGLVVVREVRDGKEWSFQVRERSNTEKADLYGRDLFNLLRKSGYKTIDILKMDIETAEKVVFAYNYERWLDRVKNIVIELHDEQCEEVFFKALSDYDYKLSQSGELTVCRNLCRKPRERLSKPVSEPDYLFELKEVS